MPRIYVGIGSNIDPGKNVRKGIRALRKRFGDLIISPVYESEPVGFTGDNFYNLVAGFDSQETCEAVAAALYEIEAGFGRSRDSARLSPRTLDLDLLLYGDRVIETGDLQLPRRDILDYAFVLKPLADVAGDQLHPVSGRSYGDLWSSFDRPGQKLWRIALDDN